MELIIPKAFPYLVNHLQTNYKYLFVTCRETVYSFIWLSFFSSPFVQPACADLRVRPACLCAVHDQRKLFMAFIYIVFVVFCVCVCVHQFFFIFGFCCFYGSFQKHHRKNTQLIWLLSWWAANHRLRSLTNWECLENDCDVHILCLFFFFLCRSSSFPKCVWDTKKGAYNITRLTSKSRFYVYYWDISN